MLPADLTEILALLLGTYIVNTLAFLTAYALSEALDHWRNDRRWKRERAAMDEAHAKARGMPRGKR